MLEQFRKHASSFLTKVLLGAIAAIFALYFGFTRFTGRQNMGGGTAPIAKVNGETIPAGLFNSDVQAQISFYQRLGQDTSSQDLQKVIEGQVLQRLINNVLFSQTAHSLGLQITDTELAQAIRTNPNFQRNGRFDENFYLKQFKPYYQRQNGQDYEFALRKLLLQDRFREVLDQASVVSHQQVDDLLQAQNIQLSLRTLEVPFQEVPDGNSKEEALKIAKEWIAAKQEGKNTASWVKAHSLEEKEDGAKSLPVLEAFFGGEESVPILSCLLKIQPGKVCQEPFQVKDHIVAVELVDRKQAKTSEVQWQDTQTQLAQAKKNQIYSGVSDLLTRGAEIETFLQKQ